MKRILAILLAVAMLLPTFAVADHVTFTQSCIDLGNGGNYTDDAMYHWVFDRFDVDMELWLTSWDNWTEKDRVWINGGTMADFMMWQKIDYTEYLSYVDQGLIAPLPEGWETDYPNLYNLVKASGVMEKLYVDGKIYALPRTTLYMFCPVEYPLHHMTTYYRKDWAEQLGYNFGTTTTQEEFLSFIRDCIKNDMAGNGKTIGFTGTPQQVFRGMCLQYQYIENGFLKNEEGKYEFILGWDSVKEALKTGNTWYHEGLIDPDFYLNQTNDGKLKFANGLAAALFEDGTVSHFNYRKTELLAAQPDIAPADVWDYIGSTVLLGPDGKWHGAVNSNYWTASVFSPELSEEKMRLLLDILEFCSTEEVQIAFALGIPGVDWQYAEDGSLEILRPANEDGTYPDIKTIYPSIYFLSSLTLLADSFGFIDPTFDKYATDTVNALYAAREEYGDFDLYDADYKFYTSDAKAQYSVDYQSEFVRLMLADATEIDGEWAKFIENNRPLWEPLLNELNETFAK